jgi:hypothetical protein
MAEQHEPSSLNPSDVPGRLHEIAQLLRKTHHLGPETQHALAELADELGKAFEQPQAPLATPVPFVESIGHVVEALHHAEGRGPLNAARQQLQELAASVEGRAPNASAFAHRLLDALADIGI